MFEELWQVGRSTEWNGFWCGRCGHGDEQAGGVRWWFEGQALAASDWVTVKLRRRGGDDFRVSVGLRYWKQTGGAWYSRGTRAETRIG